jgi:hypothetical protein
VHTPLVFLGGASCHRPLAEALAGSGAVWWVELGVQQAHARQPAARKPSGLRDLTWTYPPGFNGMLAPLFRRSIFNRVRALERQVKDETGAWPTFITAYPKFADYLADVAPDRLVYYNEDDHSRTEAGGERTEIPSEAQLVARAGRILCASYYQLEQFQQRFPDKRTQLFHLPHGVLAPAINPEPGRPARRSVVIIGTLSRRYDWRVIHDVAAALPDVRFEFIGEIDAAERGYAESKERLDRVLALPNVERRPLSSEVDNARQTWDCVLNWMPYDATLPFNLASCPLKLFTGIASGRPILSAAIPECLRYPEWVRAYRDADEAVGIIRTVLNPADSAAAARHAEAQVAFARTNTWQDRAVEFLNICDRQAAPAAGIGVVMERRS